MQYGFGQVSYTLLDHGLLDELRLWVHPFMLRSGGPQDLLFRPGPLAKFSLADVRPLKSGDVVLTYQPR